MIISCVIVNYNKKIESYRHTDAKIFYSLKDAKDFSGKIHGSGYLVVMYCNKKTDKHYSKKTVTGMFGGFNPSVQEGNIIQAIDPSFNMKKYLNK